MKQVQLVSDTPYSLCNEKKNTLNMFFIHKNNYSADFIWWNIHWPTNAGTLT